MTATEILRRMLDERGVEYEGGERSLRWRDRYGIMMQAFPLANGELGMGVWSCTPEQAIAATLGRGTCRNVAEPDEYSDRPFTCSECGARGPMGNGTYHMASSWAMKDGTLAFADSWPVWKYCPACGAKVVDPTTNDVDAEVDA